MQVAQRLYEGIELDGETVGVITYMRTDGVAISAEAIAARRHLIGSDFGPNICRTHRGSTASPRQERPRGARGDPNRPDLARKPVEVAGRLDRDQLRLYELDLEADIGEPDGILHCWSRSPSTLPMPRHVFACARMGRSSSSTGFSRFYQEDRDDAADEEGEGTRLPAMRKAEQLARGEGRAEPAFHSAAAAATPEASLVKKLEELGIGRPSTYRPRFFRFCKIAITSGSKSGDFCRRTAVASSPALLDELFRALTVQYNFTADLENQLDDVVGRAHRLEGGAAQFLARFLGRGRRAPRN